MKEGYAYILSNSKRTVFYTGVTNSIRRRILEHKAGLGSRFTRRYSVIYLMYYERFDFIGRAIVKERELKNWHRDWKINLIKIDNPDMVDLAADWFSEYELQEFRRTQDYIDR